MIEWKIRPYSSVKRFEEVNKIFEELEAKFKSLLEHSKIKPIHEDFLFAQNGLTALIAGTGTGKSYNYVRMIANSETLIPKKPFFEDIVVCSTSAKFDTTVKIYRQAIKKSNLIPIKDDDLIDFLEDYVQKAHIYNTINYFINNGLQDPSSEMIDIMKENGLINRRGEFDFIKTIIFIAKKLEEIGWETFPHRMLLVLDDFASHPLLKRKETELSRFLKRLRHFYINVIICVQTTMSIPVDLKRDLKDCIVFPGINYDDFHKLVLQSTIGKLGTPDELWKKYIKIRDPQTMIIFHVAARDIVVVPPS